MKLPEPVGVITGKLGEHCSFKSNVLRKGDSVYSEAQLREALASNEAVMRQALKCLKNSNAVSFDDLHAIAALEEQLK